MKFELVCNGCKYEADAGKSTYILDTETGLVVPKERPTYITSDGKVASNAVSGALSPDFSAWSIVQLEDFAVEIVRCYKHVATAPGFTQMLLSLMRAAMFAISEKA